MKKIFSSLFLMLLCLFYTNAFTANDIRCFTLDNGLTLFVLPDKSSAPVRIELDINAGFSCQTEKTAGFFPLYANLINADCSADTVRIVRTVAPEGIPNTLKELSQCFSSFNIDDKTLKAALDEMKSEITGYAFSTAGFINTAIDARMFPDSPWKQESGVYPAIFSNTTEQEARTILTEIGKKFYTPQNSTLYVSGNCNAETILELTKEAIYSATSHDTQKKIIDEKATTLLNTNKKNNDEQKFVLVDPEFSSDITQIVVQYNNLSVNEADTIATAFSENNSVLKQKLLKESTLAIRGAEYINAASAQKRGSSRLIIQSLFDQTKNSPVQQADLFVSILSSENVLTHSEVVNALMKYNADFSEMTSKSTSLMELLSAWHALTLNTDTQTLFDRGKALDEQTAESLSSAFYNSKPSVFVMVNKSVYEKNKKTFVKSGYKTVTTENGSWYTSEINNILAKKNTSESAEINNNYKAVDDIADSATRFITANRAEFSTLTLSNGIPVVIKHADDSPHSSFCITIKGGELLFADSAPGLCAVITDFLANSIRGQLNVRAQSGVLHGNASVEAQTNASYSIITVSCSSEDIAACLEAAGAAIVYGEITPAEADEFVYRERTSWRIKTGSTEFQLLCAAIKTIYQDNSKISQEERNARKRYRIIYDDTSDIPANTDFSKIKISYPQILDSTRYNIAITESTSGAAELIPVLNRTFGILSTHSETAYSNEKDKSSYDIPVPDFTSTKKRIALRHLFFTDVNAKDAGPRPQVLIPTKTFADPVLLIIPYSSDSTSIFDALLYEIGERLQQKIGKKSIVKVVTPTIEFPFAQIIITNVSKTSSLDAQYAKCIEELTDEISALLTTPEKIKITGSEEKKEKFPLLISMQSRWMLNKLSGTGSSDETAKLIAEGTLAGCPQKYLDDYEKISKADAATYYTELKESFKSVPQLRFYSADAR